jgi:hypothetical protein
MNTNILINKITSLKTGLQFHIYYRGLNKTKLERRVSSRTKETI